MLPVLQKRDGGWENKQQDGAREVWRSARQTGVRHGSQARTSLMFPIHHIRGRWMPFLPGRAKQVRSSSAGDDLLSLHPLFLPHRFLEALLENRLWKEIRAMTTGLPDFFTYNLWANLRLLEECAHLSNAQLDATTTGTFGSVRETLTHLFAAEEGYVRSFTGTTPTPPLKELTTFACFDELRRRAERSGKELITIAEQRDLSQIFYLDGGTYEAQAIVVVIQAINHAIDHRSQIATLLSQQGIEPPDLDGWSYNDAMHERS
jgi:uncharacterized damage-inducible protein DinB